MRTPLAKRAADGSRRSSAGVKPPAASERAGTAVSSAPMQPANMSWPPATWFVWPSSRTALLLWLGPETRNARGVDGWENEASKRLKPILGGPSRCAVLAENDVSIGNLIGGRFGSEKKPVLQQPVSNTWLCC